MLVVETAMATDKGNGINGVSNDRVNGWIRSVYFIRQHPLLMAWYAFGCDVHRHGVDFIGCPFLQGHSLAPKGSESVHITGTPLWLSLIKNPSLLEQVHHGSKNPG